MSQERYFDWKAPVGSKKVAEHIALISGIGPKYGFNVISVNSKLTSGKYELKLSSKPPTAFDKYRYITNNANVIQEHVGGIVTPDGLLTHFTGNVIIEADIPSATEFTVNGLPYYEVFIVASHLYVEDEDTIVNTSIRAIVNTTLTKLETTIGNSSSTNMMDWFNHASLAGLNKSTEVIIGLAKIFKTVSSHTIMVPYDYKWPTPVEVSQSNWDLIMDYTHGSMNNELEPLVKGFPMTTTSFNTPAFTLNPLGDNMIWSSNLPGRYVKITGKFIMNRVVGVPLPTTNIGISVPLSSLVDVGHIVGKRSSKISPIIEDSDGLLARIMSVSDAISKGIAHVIYVNNRKSMIQCLVKFNVNNDDVVINVSPPDFDVAGDIEVHIDALLAY